MTPKRRKRKIIPVDELPVNEQKFVKYIRNLNPGRGSPGYEHFETEATFILISTSHYKLLDKMLAYLDAEHPTDISVISDWVGYRLNEILGVPDEEDDDNNDE